MLSFACFGALIQSVSTVDGIAESPPVNVAAALNMRPGFRAARAHRGGERIPNARGVRSESDHVRLTRSQDLRLLADQRPMTNLMPWVHGGQVGAPSPVSPTGWNCTPFPLVGSGFPAGRPPGMLLFVQATTLHRTLADELWQADTTAVPISPLTDRHPDLTIEDAYAIQSVNIDRRVANGERICGRKIGLTSKPMQDLLGVDEPDYGVLLDGMFIEDGDVIDLPSLVQPRVEAEMAFVMESDLEGPGVNTATALQAIAGVLPAVEIVDSRVADWKIKLVDTVADNASSGLIVMGGRLRRIDELDLRLIGVAVTRGGELIDTGAGAAALGNPARCVAWLANKLAGFGAKLRAGDVVLPGAVHKMVGVQPGDVFRAEFAHLGAVTVRFSNATRGAA